MQPSTPLCCWQCGTVISAAGGRCPACGVEQQNEAPVRSPASPAALPLRRSLRSTPIRGAQRSTLTIVSWALAGAGLGAVALITFALARRSPEAPARRALSPTAHSELPPEAPADPNDLGIEDPKRVDPSALLGKAKTRALAWSKDAVLVGVKAGPVVRGLVDITSDGTIDFTFGKPTGEGFGADVRVAGKGFRILVRGSGTKVDDTAMVTGRAALEPNCPLEEAVRKATAAGIPSTSPLTVSYEVSPKHKKAVWRLEAEGDAAKARLVDGNSCAILVR